MYELSDTEYQAVLQLNADYRAAHLHQKAKAQQGLYILLQNDEPFTLTDLECDDEGVKANALPVWPHPRYIEDFIQKHNLGDAKAQFVTAKAWNEHWVDYLKQEQILIIPMMLSDDDGDFCVEDPDLILPA